MYELLLLLLWLLLLLLPPSLSLSLSGQARCPLAPFGAAPAAALGRRRAEAWGAAGQRETCHAMPRAMPCHAMQCHAMPPQPPNK